MTRGGRRRLGWLVVALLMGVQGLLAGCSPQLAAAGLQPGIAGQVPALFEEVAEVRPTATAVAEPPVTEAATVDAPPSPTPASSVIGPEYVTGINPLTGLSVNDPSVLACKPLMVAISLFPVSAREHQAGLPLAAFVFEIYDHDGMTRNLVGFYGDYVQGLTDILANRLAEAQPGFSIGPIRSGRLAFEDIKTLFPGAVLITAGASAEVAAQITNRRNVFGSESSDINSAGLDLANLQGLVPCNADPAEYAGLTFDPSPPAGGRPAPSFQVIYNHLNRVRWEYDAARAAYLQSRDRADASGEYYPSIDQLTGEQLAFPNVLVLFAEHRFVNSTATIVEVETLYVEGRKGMLFRDGRQYDITWSTRKGELRLFGPDGEPIALRPGPTYFEVVSYQSVWNPDSMTVRFHTPPLP
jgi:hypothetical protein